MRVVGTENPFYKYEKGEKLDLNNPDHNLQAIRNLSLKDRNAFIEKIGNLLNEQINKSGGIQGWLREHRSKGTWWVMMWGGDGGDTSGFNESKPGDKHLTVDINELPTTVQKNKSEVLGGRKNTNRNAQSIFRWSRIVEALGLGGGGAEKLNGDLFNSIPDTTIYFGDRLWDGPDGRRYNYRISKPDIIKVYDPNRRNFFPISE